MNTRPPALAYRCPTCLVRYPAPGEQSGGLPQPYVCMGGWPHYDPQRPGLIDPYHPPTSVERIPR